MRDHRRPRANWLTTTLGVLGFVGVCCGLTVIKTSAHFAARWIGLLPTLGLVVLGVVVAMVRADLLRRRDQRIRRELDSYLEREDWSPVTGPTSWPWTAPEGTVTVDRAYGGRFSMVFGEISWSRDALGGSTDNSTGRGVFWVVTLPRPVPDAAVQRRRGVPRRRAGEDEFRRRFRCIIDEPWIADRLAGPAVREAYVSGRIPPWTVRGDQLYVVIRTKRQLDPALVATLVDQAQTLSRLLTAPAGPDPIQEAPPGIAG
ncbi:hypothetical protein L3i22_046340 [Actinoplanes sp. L3-i22]|nr:hypothetical protein L3i22_046340 [Actinoplanes sp. L3-i22]